MENLHPYTLPVLVALQQQNGLRFNDILAAVRQIYPEATKRSLVAILKELISHQWIIEKRQPGPSQFVYSKGLLCPELSEIAPQD